jgi:RimJ/RimL family protein N-acetyltransferase
LSIQDDFHRPLVVAPQLRTARIRLRVLDPEDYPSLFRLATDEQVSYLWKYRGATPSYEDFVRTLFPGVICQFIVSPLEGRDILGLVVAYNADLRNGYCYGALVMAPKYMNTGLGGEAFALFCNYVFQIWSIRKMYLETLEYQSERFEGAVKAGLIREEGRLREHAFFGDRFWDQLILAVWREDVEQARAGRLGHLIMKNAVASEGSASGSVDS